MLGSFSTNQEQNVHFPTLGIGYMFPSLSAGCTFLVQVLVMIITGFGYSNPRKTHTNKTAFQKVMESISLHTLLQTSGQHGLLLSPYT